MRNFIICTHPQISLGKSRRMRWADHVARMGEERKVYKVLGESPREGDHLEDQGISGKMGSEWILGRLAWGCGLDSTVSGQGPVADCCQCGDEPSGSCATELVSSWDYTVNNDGNNNSNIDSTESCSITYSI
jgi:hypothetical protein